MSETVFHGYLGPARRLLLLKLLEKNGDHGILGFRMGNLRLWFWIGDGQVRFGRALGDIPPDLRHPVTALDTAPSDPEPGDPHTLLQHVSAAASPDPAAAWKAWYGRALARVLQEPADVECLWIARAGSAHPDMVPLPIATWVLHAVETAGAADLWQRLGVDPDRWRAGRDAGPHEAGSPAHDPQQAQELWHAIWSGTARCEEPAPQPAPARDIELLEPLLQFYSDAFSVLSEYLIEELGELGPAMLRKNLAQLASAHPLLLQELDYSETFTILHWRPRLEALIRNQHMSLADIGQVLDELLMLNLFSTQNILGNMHYTTLLATIQTLRRAHLPSAS